MAIVNRDLDVSQQCIPLGTYLGNVVTGTVYYVATVPYPCTLKSILVGAVGISGAPIFSFEKFTGTGSSGYAIGISGMVVLARGTSGVLGFSGLAATGSSLLMFNSGDVLAINPSGTSTFANGCHATAVFQKTQDIVSHLGV